MKTVGLTTATFGVLNVVGSRNEGAIQHKLSAEMGIDPSAMVTLVNELEKAGLAERRRRPGDRRAWEVSVTSKGRRTLARAKRLAAQVEGEVLGGLSLTERHQLMALLRQALISVAVTPPWRSEEDD